MHKYGAWLWSVDRQNQFITTKINDFPTDEYIKFEIHQQQSGSAHRMHLLCLSLRFNLLLRLKRNTKTPSGNIGSGERRIWLKHVDLILFLPSCEFDSQRTHV